MLSEVEGSQELLRIVGEVGAVDALRRMEIAEDEIARAKRRDPHRRKRYHSAFLLLRPTEFFKGKADRVYRAHVRELLARVALGSDTRPGTAAEVLCGMLGAATVAPLNAQSAALTERLFQIVMRQEVEGEPAREVWEGQVEEDFRAAKRKTRADWRAT